MDVAIPRLQKSKIEELITTNSTPVRTVEGFKITVLCVSELLGEGMKRIHNDESVSSLFKIDNENKWQNKLNSKQNRGRRRGTFGCAEIESARDRSGGHLRRRTTNRSRLQVSARDINAMLSHASGENILVELEIAGDKASRTALVQEVQHSPVGGDVLHVDFHAVSMDEEDPGRSAAGADRDGQRASRTFGGLLEQSLRVAGDRMSCRAICRIESSVDVSALNIGDSIHVRDIQLPHGVTAKGAARSDCVLSGRAGGGRRAGCAEAEARCGWSGSDHREEGRRRSGGRSCGSKAKAPKEKEAKK